MTGLELIVSHSPTDWAWGDSEPQPYWLGLSWQWTTALLTGLELIVNHSPTDWAWAESELIVRDWHEIVNREYISNFDSEQDY